MKLKITSVDRDSLCGREYHPSESDIGKCGVVVGVSSILYSDDDMAIECDGNDWRQTRALPIPLGKGYLIIPIFVILMESGDMLEVAEYEVEVVPSEFKS